MQFIAIAALLAASFTHAQTVPGNAPGCVKYCLRVAREQTPSACTWAGWCGTSGFQESVTNCYSNICGPTNRQVGIQIYQQICSSAGSNTECPSATAATSSSSTLSTASTASTSSGSETSTTSELVTTTIGSTTTTIPASATSSLASEASTSSEGASSSIESIQSSLSSAVSTATAPVSSAISSILASASSVAASASTATNPASQTANTATAIGLPTSGQLVSVGVMVLGVAAGAIIL